MSIDSYNNPADTRQEGKTMATLSIVIPAHNEAEGIALTLQKLKNVLNTCNIKYELIVVDDGSHDGTFETVSKLSQQDSTIKGLRFSRNFGKESAILGGLKAASGDAVITIDADLQHPPEIMPEMLEKWRNGVKIVHAVKRDRSQDSAFARSRAVLFNRLLAYLGGIDLQNASDYKLLDRVAVDILVKHLPEQKRFYRGLSNWIGYKQSIVQFDVASRSTGNSKWSFMALLDLATTAIVSFTTAPLRIITALGFITLIFGFFLGITTFFSWFVGESVSGFATIIITILILGSFIMISLGIVGEYIAKIYEEIKRRPLFIVEEEVGFCDNIPELTDVNSGLDNGQ